MLPEQEDQDRDPKLYVRKDDPVEKVKIVSQTRTPNGEIRFEIVEPPSAAGAQHTLRANEFWNLYYDPSRPEPGPSDQRPPSWGTAQQWRAYALHLEQKLGMFKPEVFRQSDRNGDAIEASRAATDQPLGPGDFLYA